MPSILASTILTKASTILQDVTGIRWPVSTELLGWLNDGQREVCIPYPEASVVTKAVLLVAGTKQTIGSGSTADAVTLLKVIRNMGINGTSPGDAIRPVAGEILDAQVPGWHAVTSTSTVKHSVHDLRSQKQFYVYPPNTGTGYVEIMYTAAPTDCATTASTIGVDDIFANALLDYVLYRAYSKDAEYTKNEARAAAHYQQFVNSLGIRNKRTAEGSPNLDGQPINPNLRGVR